MFKRSKRKIVAAVTLSLLAFMLLLSGAIFVSSRIKLHMRYMELLDKYIERYVVRNPQSNTGSVDEDREYQTADFRFAVFNNSTDSVISISAGQTHDTEDTERMARELIKKGRLSGQTDGIAYKIKKAEALTIVAFMDTTLTDSGVDTILKMTLLFGTGAIVVIFVIAVLIARKIVKPLEDNDARQRAFVSDAGHELKTPVSVISANTELLVRQGGENEQLSNIRFETERMGRLISQLLDLSRAESGKGDVEDVDFGRLILGEVLYFESVAFERGLVINSDIAEGCTVRANSVQLTKLVTVLLDNAVKYASGGSIDIKLSRERKKAIFTMTNDAEAIPPEKLARIFDRFYRVDEVRGADDNHYGLGLSIAKAVVTEYKGSICAEYKDGRITFRVVLTVI